MRHDVASFAPIVGALLVGGASARFGRPKQLVRWRGQTLAEHVAAAMSRQVVELCLVGAGEVAAALAGWPRIDDLPGVHGPIAGIAAALGARPGSAVLALACDQPLIDEAALAWLISNRRPGLLAVLARLGGSGVEPLPGLYEPAVLPLLEQLVAAGGSLQPLGRRSDVQVIAPPAELRAGWTSVDTVELLQGLDLR